VPRIHRSTPILHVFLFIRIHFFTFLYGEFDRGVGYSPEMPCFLPEGKTGPHLKGCLPASLSPANQKRAQKGHHRVSAVDPRDIEHEGKIAK
jgi:hypothetical protein